MCIIADNVNNVSKTKIACMHVGFSFDGGKNVIPGQLTVYSANIDSQVNTNALILPVFNPGNDPKKIIPLDFSTESKFFHDLKMIYARWFGYKMRNKSYAMKNCFDGDSSTLDVHIVGDYKFSIMSSKLDFNRLDRTQLNINPASKISIDVHNNDYSFIVYQFYQKGNIDITPFGYLNECDINSQNLVVPTIHGHPHDDMSTNFGIDSYSLRQPHSSAPHKSEFEDTAHYDHVIYTLIKLNENSFDPHPLKSNFMESNYNQSDKNIATDQNDIFVMNHLLKKINTDYMKRKIKLYVPKKFIPNKIEINDFTKNRNIVVGKNGFAFINDLVIDLK